VISTKGAALTKNLISSIKRPVGRKQINGPGEQIPARFPEGTRKRIDAVLDEKEPIAAFLREAVERELTRREREQRKRQ
jgi:hypothetical protein